MRVLVLEDNPVPRLLRALRDLGMDPILVTTRAEALRLLVKQAFDAAILDLRLEPNDLFGGLVVAEQFRARYPELPIILFTGNGDKDIIEACARLRIRFVAKPALASDLVLALRGGETMPERTHSGVRRRLQAPPESPTTTDAIVLTADGWRLRYHLTQMEAAVLVEAARGLSRATIASQLGLTSETVKSHARSLIRKTGDEDLSSAGLRLLRELVDGLSQSKQLDQR